MPYWVFPSNNNTQINGINDTGVETFRGTPIKSLAREICQNSLDANLDNTSPTRVVFSTYRVSPEAIPGIGGLRKAFNSSIDFWCSMENDKTTKFFKNALTIADSQEIVCLRISDFNTTGLVGSHQPFNSPWSNLTKSTGVSDKGGSNGGSFGIGKFAPFACSAFRTVFYSTHDNEGNDAYQGVSRLVSYKLSEDEISQGIGYYGGAKCSPLYTQIQLDTNYSRAATDYGTDIYILAFQHDDDWKNDLIASIIDGFLYAIYRGSLIVDVDGTIVSKDTLNTLMVTYQKDFKEYAFDYYRVLTDESANTRVFETDILGKGKVILRMTLNADMNRRCAMVRKTGMKIMDRDRISATIPFAAVLFIEGDDLNSYLRKLENPKHTAWQLDRAEKKSEARAVIKAMVDFIIQSLNEMKGATEHESIDPMLGEFLAFTSQSNDQKSVDQQEDLTDNIKSITTKDQRKIENTTSGISDPNGTDHTSVEVDDGGYIEEGPPGNGSGGSIGHGNGADIGGGSENGSGNGPHDGTNDGPNPIEHTMECSPVAPARQRTICINKKNGEYRIIFTPSVNTVGSYLRVYQTAETQSYDAILISASTDGKPLPIKKNMVSGLVFTANKPIQIDIRIDYTDFCSLEVKAYGHKV